MSEEATKVTKPNAAIKICPECKSANFKYEKDKLESEMFVVLRNSGGMVFQEGPEWDENSLAIIEELKGKFSEEVLDTIKQPNYKLIKEVSYDDIASIIHSTHGSSTGIMPIGTTYQDFWQTDQGIKTRLMIISRPPEVFTFKLRKPDSREHNTYKISIPFNHMLMILKEAGEIFQLDFRHTYFFLSKTPLRSLEDDIYCFPGPNQWADGRFCWGQVKIPEDRDLHRYILTLRGALSESIWNSDLAGEAGNGLPSPITSYQDWHERTINNPYFSVTEPPKWKQRKNLEKLSKLIQQAKRQLHT